MPRRRRRFNNTRRRRFRRTRRTRGFKRYLFKRTSVLESPYYQFPEDGDFKGILNAPYTLDQLPDFGDFTNLYDQYRINMIKVVIAPQGNIAPVVSSDGATDYFSYLPEVWSILNYSNDPITTFDEMQQYQNVRKTNKGRVHKRVFKPTVRMPAYVNAGSTPPTFGYTWKKRQWIDCGNADVPHFGVYAACGYPGTLPSPGTNFITSYQLFTVTVTYYLQFRNVK